jgi:hypothetical protein
VQRQVQDTSRTNKAASVAIVVTTIGDGTFLQALMPLLRNPKARTNVIVIGDENTHPDCAANILRVASEGHDITWMDVEAQRGWLSQIPWLAAHIPWRSDNRRNIGILEGWRRGHDVIVLMDDDNVPADPDEFIAMYSRVGSTIEAPQIISESRWINVCELLTCRSSRGADEPLHVYPRGHPISRRDESRIRVSPQTSAAPVVLHLGLWTGEPDVDAATRAAVAPISGAATVTGPVLAPANALLATSSQNVAAARRLIPAWWYVRMGSVAPGLVMDRFGDILQGCFAIMAIAALEERVALGPPLVHHRRNPHALFHDLAMELPGMALLEALLPMLEAPARPAKSYADAYLEVANALTDHARTVRPALWGDGLPAWADSTAASMEAWVKACRLLEPTA